MKFKSRGSRRGATWPLLLAMLSLMLAGIALAVDASLLWQARQELQVAADASSLAAVQQLADDRVLLKQPGVMAAAVEQARQAAVGYARQHHVLGQPLRLEVDGAAPDVVFGFFDGVTQQFQPATSGDEDSPFLNAVEVTGRRNRERGNAPGLFFARLFRLPAANVAASATAVLDRQVIGFRPQGTVNAPLVPLALLSDPQGLDEQSWEGQVDRPLSAGGGGQDQYAFDPVNRRWSNVGESGLPGDGLPEFALRLPLSGTEPGNGQAIQLGPPGLRHWVRQVTEGVQATDLAAWQGQLTLGWDGLCPVPEGPMPGSSSVEHLVLRLRELQSSGEPRAWPLFVPAAAATTGPGPTVLLRGFVAARVADVIMSDEEATLIVVLQPTVLVSGTALTQATAEINPYLAKARLLR